MSVLGDYVTFANGGTPPRSQAELWNGDIPWITGADIAESGSVSPRAFISPEAVRRSSTQVLPAGTVLLLTRTAVGKVGILPRAMAINQDITGVMPSKDIDTRFLVWFLRASAQSLAQKARGATIKGVTRADVASMPLDLPPTHEQRRIAAILDRADAIRTKRRQVLSRLDSLADSVFADMFGGTTAHPRVALQDLTTLVTKGTTPTTLGLKFSEHGVRFLRAQNLQRGSVSFGDDDLHIDQAAHDQLRRSWIYPGDLLISIAGTIGRVALAPGDSPTMNCNQAVAIVRLAAPETGPWVRAWLNTSDARNQIGASAVTGTISNLSLGQIRQLKVPRIPRGDIDEYVRRCAEIALLQGRLDSAVEADDALFASLQSRAFIGEL